MRVLHVFGVLNIGGAETMIMNLYRKINRENIQFDFVVHGQEHGFFEEEISALGGVIYRCPKYSFHTFLQYKKWWKNFFKSHKEYQILHSHIRSTASIYIPLARKNGLKTIIHSHSTSNGKGVSSVLKAILQYPLRYQADYYMACSKLAGEWLFGKKKCKQAEFNIIKNAIDTEKFIFDKTKRNEIRARLGIKDEFVLGFLARVAEPKNPLFVIDVFSALRKKLPNSKLLFVGDGDLLASVKKRVDELGLTGDVVFTGARDDAFNYYQAMDCYILPSLWEGLGISLIEAQASGLKCICSENIQQDAIVIEDSVIQMELSKGPIEWAKAIISTVGNTRENCFSKIEKSGYDINSSVEKITNYYLLLEE